MDFFKLNGKVAMITGGNGGIGLAYAKGLTKAGAKVALWGRNAEKNKAAKEEIISLGGEAESFICDVTDSSMVDKAFEETMKHFGQVDICFANAGGAGPQGMLHQLEEASWKNMIDLNLNSVVYTYQKVIAQLIERKAPGKLIVTSSIAGLVGTSFAAGYGTTKAAVLGLTRALAVELGKHQIQVNAVLPGYIGTAMTENAPKFFKEGVTRRSCSGRLGSLDQMEGVAVFLASSASDYITGQNIIMDGGHTVFPL